MRGKRVSISPSPLTEQRAEAWVQERTEGRASSTAIKSVLYTARLTIDVTPEMRARIKVAAFQSETTVAELVRRLLEREFPSGDCTAFP
jgi:hypothetical protein